MEVKIGVQNATRELVLDSAESSDAVEKAVAAALSGEGKILTLADSKGRRVLVPTDKLAYVEIGSPSAGQSAFVVDRVRKAIAAEPRLGGRLALWGRRLMGEALSQAQRVAAERDALTALLAGGVDRPGLDLAAIGRLFTRLTENHAKRMEALGLSA